MEALSIAQQVGQTVPLSDGLFREGAAVQYDRIEVMRQDYPVTLLCGVFEAGASGDYAASKCCCAHGRMPGWTRTLVMQTLFGAVVLRRPAQGLIADANRGSQYCSHDDRALTKQFGMKMSMSREGDCYDNAPRESFWGLLKNELVHHARFATRQQARHAITEYIEFFC